MSEIRRKLVIVGDGACGKVSVVSVVRARMRRRTTPVLTTQPSPTDLFADCVLERNVPRGTCPFGTGMALVLESYYPCCSRANTTALTVVIGLRAYCLRELRCRCGGRWQARRTGVVGYGWPRGL